MDELWGTTPHKMWSRQAKLAYNKIAVVSSDEQQYTVEMEMLARLKYAIFSVY